MIADGVVEHGFDVAYWDVEETRRPDTRLVWVVGILLHVGELGIFRHHVSILVAIKLVSDE